VLGKGSSSRYPVLLLHDISCVAVALQWSTAHGITTMSRDIFADCHT